MNDYQIHTVNCLQCRHSPCQPERMCLVGLKAWAKDPPWLVVTFSDPVTRIGDRAYKELRRADVQRLVQKHTVLDDMAAIDPTS